MKIKVCGITNLVDARAAVQAGADFLGFICYPPSPRYIRPEIAQQIITALRPVSQTVRTVGVFVNAPVAEIRRVMAVAGFDLAQLHGDEPEELLITLRGYAFKAVRPRTPAEAMAAATSYIAVAPQDQRAPQLLIDAYQPDVYGGSGKTGDWSLARALSEQCPRMLLAGGLTPENVGEALAQVHPWGVDVSSGVEIAPGRKDHGRLRAFIATARAAADRFTIET